MEQLINKDEFSFLPYNEVPVYLKKIKTSPNFVFTYKSGSVLIPDINARVNQFLHKYNLIDDKDFILKRLRKYINEVTSVNRKQNKINSIKNARKEQCKKYEEDLDSLYTNPNEENDFIKSFIKQTNSKKKQKQSIKLRKSERIAKKNLPVYKSKRIKKKASKYNPFTGKAQIVGTGFCLLNT